MTISRRPPPALGDLSQQDWKHVRGPVSRFLDWCRQNYSGHPAPHQATHLAGGSDALQTPVLPDAIVLENAAGTPARGAGPAYAYDDHDHGNIKRDVRIKKAGADVGTRNALNLIEGSNVTLTVTDNPGSDRVDVTVASSGGGGASTARRLAWYFGA